MHRLVAARVLQQLAVIGKHAERYHLLLKSDDLGRRGRMAAMRSSMLGSSGTESAHES